MTADDFRRLALDMQGAVEGAHMGHPDFRANGRIFASLHSGDRRGMVKLTPEDQDELVRTNPEAFAPSSGAWGRQGCTDVRLDAADVATVRAAMLLAWEAVSMQRRGRLSSARRGARSRRGRSESRGR